VKSYTWNENKNRLLKSERGVSFEEVLAAIASGGVLDIVAHPNASRYPNQRIFIIQLHGYAWLVPFIEGDDEIFLKTIIPSRKATKQYFGGKDGED
jgi:uncharacterized DUF497 family protein